MEAGMTSINISTNTLSSKRVAIVGAGLSGLFAAIALAKKGVDVWVFDKRARESAVGGNSRSFNLTLSSRGQKALQEQGIWNVIEPITMPISGRMCRSGLKKDPFEYSADRSLLLHSVQRSSLNGLLLKQAERCPNVTVRYNQSLTVLKEDDGTLIMQNTRNGNTFSYSQFDLIIGADGANSKTRKLIQNGKAVSSSQMFLEWGYRELKIPSKACKSSHSFMEPNYLHLWPRADFMMFALPNRDGSFGANFIFPLDKESKIFELEYLGQLLKDQFPDLGSISKSIASDLMQKKTSLFFSQRSSLWHSDNRTVLIGDAAHSTVPFYGQGMNCAFEGVTQLVSMLEREWSSTPLIYIFKKYQSVRKPHTDKIADLSVQNFDDLRRDFGQLGPQAERMAEVLFHKLAPNVFTPMHILISHGELGYLDAEKKYLRQRRLAKWLGLDVLKQVCAAWIATNSYYDQYPYLIRPY